MSTTPSDASDRTDAGSPGTTGGSGRIGPPAPGQSEPGPFGPSRTAIPTVEGSHAPGAWETLMGALGRDLQGGIYRAEQARRRIARMR